MNWSLDYFKFPCLHLLRIYVLNSMVFFLSDVNIVTPNSYVLLYAIFLSFYIQLQLPFSLYLISITHWQHRVRACYLIQTEICLLIGVYSPFTLNVIIDVIGFKSTFSVFISYFLYLLFFFCFTFLNFYVNSIMFDLVL